MDQPSPERIDHLLDAAFTLAARDGWLSVSVAEIAIQGGVPVGDALAVFPTKPAILEALLERVEERMLADARPDFAEPVRDRLFEMVMLRFDALAPYRAGLARMLRDLPADPLTLLSTLPGFGGRLARMLEAAGVSTTGLPGLLRVEGFALIYLDALRTWIDDDSPDMAKTMAALDRGLRRAESVMRFAEGLVPPRLRPGGEPERAEVPPPPEAGAAPGPDSMDSAL